MYEKESELSKNRILNILENYNVKISQIQSLENITDRPVDLKSLKLLLATINCKFTLRLLSPESN